jgi:hypothetical protein
MQKLSTEKILPHGQKWPKHVKSKFYVLILCLLHLMDLTTHSCTETDLHEKGNEGEKMNF